MDEKDGVYIHNVIQPQKRNEVLIHALTWTTFENIVLRKEARHKRPLLHDSVDLKRTE